MSSTLVLTGLCWQTPQVSFEDKEAETCQLFDDRQQYCAEEMEGLKQRCSTKLRQVSQIAAKAQQALQSQVRQLQVSVAPPTSPRRTSNPLTFPGQMRKNRRTHALFLSIKLCIFNKRNVCTGGQREASRGRLQAQPREGSRRAQTEVLRNRENTSGANTGRDPMGGEDEAPGRLFLNQGKIMIKVNKMSLLIPLSYLREI